MQWLEFPFLVILKKKAEKHKLLTGIYCLSNQHIIITFFPSYKQIAAH